MAPIALNVVIAGAGPGGFAAAEVLARAGARVTILERAIDPRIVVNEARRASVSLPYDGWRTLHLLGAGPQLRSHATQVADTTWMASLRAIDDSLRSSVELHGVKPSYGVEVLHTRPLETAVAGVLVETASVNGHSKRLSADWMLDMTGGHIDHLDAPQLDKQFVASASGQSERAFVTARMSSMPERPAMWNAPAVGAFAVNNVREAVAMVYAPFDFGAGRPTVAGQMHLLRAAFDELAIAPEQLESARQGIVHVRQQLAPSAGVGRVLTGGDSVATHLPHHQVGVTLALEDGVNAARAVLEAYAHPHREAEIVSAYSAQTTALHSIYAS